MVLLFGFIGLLIIQSTIDARRKIHINFIYSLTISFSFQEFTFRTMYHSIHVGLFSMSFSMHIQWILIFIINAMNRVRPMNVRVTISSGMMLPKLVIGPIQSSNQQQRVYFHLGITLFLSIFKNLLHLVTEPTIPFTFTTQTTFPTTPFTFTTQTTTVTPFTFVTRTTASRTPFTFITRTSTESPVITFTPAPQPETTFAPVGSLCQSNPCGEHGRCIESSLTIPVESRRFACICDEDYIGRLCDKRIDEGNIVCFSNQIDFQQ